MSFRSLMILFACACGEIPGKIEDLRAELLGEETPPDSDPSDTGGGLLGGCPLRIQSGGAMDVNGLVYVENSRLRCALGFGQLNAAETDCGGAWYGVPYGIHEFDLENPLPSTTLLLQVSIGAAEEEVTLMSEVEGGRVFILPNDAAAAVAPRRVARALSRYVGNQADTSVMVIPDCNGTVTDRRDFDLLSWLRR